MEIKCVIASHKRADCVTTTQVVPGCSICVPKAQAAEYKKHNPGVEIMAHPDNLVGKCSKMNWLINQNQDMFFLDDDISKVTRLYESSTTNMKPAEVRELIEATAGTTKNLSAYPFGFSNFGRPEHYISNSPFTFTKFVAGHAFGLLKNSRLFIDDRLMILDDYFLTLYNAYLNRINFVDNRFIFHHKKTFGKRGGNAGLRNMQSEKKELDLLKKMFGPAVETKQNRHLGIQTITHEFEKTLKIPF